jgi:hypothetical protein
MLATINHVEGIITLRWIPAHVGIIGNELADQAASQCISESLPLSISNDVEHSLHSIPPTPSAARNMIRENINEKFDLWINQNMKETQSIVHLVPRIPFWSGRKTSRHRFSMKQNLKSWLFRVRTGHSRLGAHSTRFTKRPDASALCPSCLQSEETSVHVLFMCSLVPNSVVKIRKTMRNAYPSVPFATLLMSDDDNVVLLLLQLLNALKISGRSF